MLSATAPLALQENVSDGAKIVGRDPYGISRSYGSRWQDSRRQRYIVCDDTSGTDDGTLADCNAF